MTALTQEFPENISGINLLREEGAWKYIDVSQEVPRASLLQLLREMPGDRELCFFEYDNAEQIGDGNGMYVMLQTFRNVCYFWKGSHGKASPLERMDIADAGDFILQHLGPKDAFLYLVPNNRRFQDRADFRWHNAPERAEDGQAELLRHLVATIAYRFQRVVNQCDPEFGDFSVGEGVRTPREITHHMRDVIAATYEKLVDQPRVKLVEESWQGEIATFHQALEALDQALISSSASELLFKKLLQGPLSDVLTHIGQVAMLRRMYGSPVPGVNYFRGQVRTGNTSSNQF